MGTHQAALLRILVFQLSCAFALRGGPSPARSEPSEQHPRLSIFEIFFVYRQFSKAELLLLNIQELMIQYPLPLSLPPKSSVGYSYTLELQLSAFLRWRALQVLASAQE